MATQRTFTLAIQNPKCIRLCFRLLVCILRWITYYLFSKDVTEITVNGIGEFFKPPLLYLTIGFIVMVVGAIFSTISRIMAFVKSFKNGDNPIIMEKNRVMKEKERIEGEIDQLKEDYKNYNQDNNNE